MPTIVSNYSRPAPQSIAEWVTSHYALAAPLRSQFYAAGLHDNYLLEDTTDRFILRLYRTQWRSSEEVNFELELLAFLRERTAPVAAPLRTRDNALCCTFACPEGARTAALFPYAEGHAPGNAITPEQSGLLGKTVAQLHQLSETFTTEHSRTELDLPYLLDASIKAIESFVDREARTYLGTLQQKLHSALPTLQKTPGVYGICTGDVNPSNFHINARQQITLFDFDQCGYGYRAFEIGKFIASVHALQNKPAIARAFLDGYQELRRLAQDELAAIAYFEIVANLWVMAIHAWNAEHIGYKWLEPAFWDRRLAVIKQLDAALSA